MDLIAFLTYQSFFSEDITVVDTVQPFSQHNIPFHEMNFHIYNNDVLYGNGTKQIAIAQAGSVLYFDKGDLRHIYFKNRTAGNNGLVVAVGTVPFEPTLKALRL